jgi:hypothetical protein
MKSLTTMRIGVSSRDDGPRTGGTIGARQHHHERPGRNRHVGRRNSPTEAREPVPERGAAKSFADRVSIPGTPFVVVVSGATGTAGTRGATVSTTYVSATGAPTSTSPAPRRSDRRSPTLPRITVVVGLVAAAAVTAVAGALHAAGVSLTVQGGDIPLAAFAQMTLVGALIGGVIVAVLNRRSVHAHRRFLQIAIALTALSCIPSIASPPDVATKVALVVTHLVAAAIIIPVLARHAHD